MYSVTDYILEMPESPIHNQAPEAILGGTSTTSTPANNVGGGAGWGDKSFKKGGTDSDDEDHHDSSHMSVCNVLPSVRTKLTKHPVRRLRWELRLVSSTTKRARNTNF